MSDGPDPRIEGADELRVSDPPPAGPDTTPSPFGGKPPPSAPAAPAAPAAPPADDAAVQHVPGGLKIPAGVGVFAGAADGNRRSVGIVVARFNGDLTSKLLTGALEFLEKAGVDRGRVDVMQVPGAFELPLGAMALARTRRYACVVALGVVIRGDTPHFDYISAEAASGIQLAALETGIPVTLGVLTCDTRAQAEARSGGAKGNKGAEAARSALEMADVLGRLRSDAVVTAGPQPA
jgi:6,7-dimethyl-8-ribityllumazine synthase